MDEKILLEMGLTKNESEIFLTLVYKGKMSTSAIAKATGLNRPYVYYALERLIEKGYVFGIKDQGKKIFNAVNLQHVVSLEEHKIKVFEKFMKGLEKKRLEEKEEVEVEVLKGKHSVRNVIRLIMSEVKPCETVLYLGLKEEIMEGVEPIYVRQFLNFLKENNIKEKVILAEGGKKLSYARTTKYKFLPSKLVGDVAKMLFSDCVVELVYTQPMYAVVMKNKKMASVAKEQFEVFWKMAGKC